MLTVFHNSLMLTVAGILAWTLRYPNGGMLNFFIQPVENSTKPAFELYPSTDELMHDALRIVLGQIPHLQTLRALPEGLGGGEAGVKAASQRPNREHYFIWVPVAVFLFISVCTLIFLIALCVSSYKLHRSGVRAGAYTASRANTHRCVQVLLALFFAGLLIMTVLYFIGAANLMIFLTEKAPQEQVDCLAAENLQLLPGLTCGMKALESYLNNTIGDFGVVITEATDHIINTTNIADGRIILERMTDAVTKVESLLTKPLGGSVVSDLRNAVQSLKASKDAYQRVFEIVDARYISTKAALDPTAVNQSISDLGASINASLQTLTDGTLKSVLLQSYRSVVGRIETRLEQEVGKIIADTTQTSFPCDKASYAWKAVTGVVCGPSGVVQQLFGLGLLIALETLFLCFFYTSLFYFSHVHSSIVA
nr:unnamed protein product [Spirometra erinaceieuropaei]